MNKIYKITILFLITSVFFYGCDDRLKELNTDKINPSSVDESSLFTQGIKGTFDIVTSTSVSNNPFRLYSQYWAQTTYPEESQYTLGARSIPRNFWSQIYTNNLVNLERSKTVINQKIDDFKKNGGILDLDEQENKKALIEILQVYNYSLLVDAFGNIPYSEALDNENFTPKYDDALSVYKDLLKRLDNAIKKIKFDKLSFPSSQDVIYSGNLNNWVKFANSLKLRMGIKLSEVDKSLSVSVVNAAISGGVFSSNSDNATMTYLKSNPETNPVYAALVLSGRNDYVSANTFTEVLNDLKDPRIFKFVSGPVSYPFKENQNEVTLDFGIYEIKKDGSSNYLAKGSKIDVLNHKNSKFYLGGVYGTANSYKKYSKVAKVLTTDPTLPGILIGYSEVEFLLAEAAEIGGYSVSGSAEDHYKNGVKASFDQWGVSGYDDYITQPSIAYSSATGTYKQKIGKQLWIALYNQGFESWCAWRRLDFGIMKPLPKTSSVTIPLRFTYPQEEAQVNGANFKEAGVAIGGDEVTTKVFWDKN